MDFVMQVSAWAIGKNSFGQCSTLLTKLQKMAYLQGKMTQSSLETTSKCIYYDPSAVSVVLLISVRLYFQSRPSYCY
jgi:hypothetical protein